MYYILNSELYYNRIILEKNEDQIPPEEVPEEEIPNEEEIPDEEEIPNDTEEEVPIDAPEEMPNSNEEIPANSEEVEPPAEDDPEEQKKRFQAIQKFILYHKLRELQYKLEDLNTINAYNDKEKIMQFTKFLSYVVTFFSIFDYKQASKLTNNILIEFKKIK